MACNRFIKIQKLNLETEEWKDYYSCYAEINKTSGKEYFSAGTNINSNTYNFRVMCSRKLESLMFNTSQYRLIYNKKVFDIINVDDVKEKRIKLTIVGKCTSI